MREGVAPFTPPSARTTGSRAPHPFAPNLSKGFPFLSYREEENKGLRQAQPERINFQEPEQ